jgi:hypothetical protein
MKREFKHWSDGQQFYQYQQNKQSPHTLTYWTQKRPWLIYGIGNPCPGFGKAHRCGQVKLFDPNPPLLVTG